MNAHKTITLFAVAATFSATLALPAVSSASLTYDAALKCRKTVTARGKTYANARRRLMLSCIGKLLKCSLMEEIEHTNAKSCRDAARSACISKLNTADQSLLLAQQKFSEKIGLGCAAMTVGNMCSTSGGGLWFGNDATCGSSNANTCGGSADLPTLLSCLRSKIDAEVDQNVGRVAPRGGMLLDNIGLGPNFPALPRPATTTVTVTATVSGTLDNPGTISLTAGNSLTVIGDSGTLPCGMNANNGKLTVQIGTGTNCNDIVAEQEAQASEPYGASEALVFGPYNDDRIFCMNLKDTGGGGCTTGQGSNVDGAVDLDVPNPQPTPPTSSTVMMACHNKLQGKVKTLSGFVANKLHACGDKVAKCELKNEIDGMGMCTPNYTTPCSTLVDKVETTLSTFKANVTLTGKCPIIPFAHLRSFVGGLGFSNGAAGCSGAGTLTALADCVYGVADTAGGTTCDVEQKSFIRDPRLFDSLQNKAGLTPATDFPCVGP